jgi:hypothetical protein
MAINTAAKVRDEGNWDLGPWGGQIVSSTELDTYIGEMLDRANNYLRFRVGTTWYTANNAVDPLDDVLKEAEMHLCQAQMLLAAAGILETDGEARPFTLSGTSEGMIRVAQTRRAWAEELILATRAAGSDARPILTKEPK